MILVICAGCGRSMQFIKLRLNAKLKCSACGAGRPVVIRKPKIWFAPPLPRPVEQARCGTYNALLWFARESRFRDGWAAWKFKALYGDWPSDEDRKFTMVEQPLQYELMLWIRRERARRNAERRKEDEIVGVRRPPLRRPRSRVQNAG